ncbi:VanW family protein [Halobacillus litoralis]|uniref:VanW family protein n=1 Tax=Halobacillus litoralis TaxID=45668 RepID=UPI001CFC5D8B|nr:VanW family protein [Halobacillus litoralis]WLR46119.1 VanW family protein [Halobacillus litoralis]
MRQSLNFKLISLVVAVGMSMFLFTMGSSAAIQYVTNGEHLPENTVIASVNLSKKSKEEAVQLLSEKVQNWKDNHSVVVRLDGKELTVDPEMFQFDVIGTVEQAMNTSKRDLQVTIDDSYVTDLRSHMNDSLATEFYQEQFIETVKRDAAQLIESPLEYVAYEFVKGNTASLYESIGEHKVIVPHETSMDRSVKLFDGEELENGAVFSFNRLLNNDGVYDEVSLDVLASAIYGASLNAGMIIQERHISHRLPEYARIGMEANVDLNQGQDLKVYNPFSGDYQLSVSVEEGSVDVQWIGYPTTSDFHVQVLDREEIPPKTIIQYSSLVNKGTFNLLQEGVNGEVVLVYRVDRSLPEGVQEFISEDYYPPIARVEEHPSVDDESPTENSGSDTGDRSSNTGNAINDTDEYDTGGNSSDPKSIHRDEDGIWEVVPEGESK